MGGVILFGIFVVVVALLLAPALRARAQARRESRSQAAHDEVVRRLDDQSRRLPDKDDGSTSD